MKNRTQLVIGVMVLGIGVLLAGILGMFAYMSATATPLHPDPTKVPTVMTSSPPPAWAAAAERGREIARAGLTEQNLPGLSVAVGAGGAIVWAEGFGYASLEEQVRVTPDTQFRIGTASTMLTAAAVGMLIEKDRLNLDEEIQKYVPDFPRKEWPVTLRLLMGHVAGVRNDAGDEENVREHCEATVDGLQRFADRSLIFEPGTRYRYSTYGYILVSAVIEGAANKPFYSFMRSQLFEPLGMTRTTVDSPTEAVRDRAIYYFPKFAGDPRYGPQSPDEVDYSCFAGASAFLSTPSDLVRFGLALDSGKLLQPATVQLLQAPQRLRSGEETGYGLGFDLETVELGGRPRQLVVHDGDLRGGRVGSFLSFPERGIVVAVLSNTSYADTASVALGIAQAFVERSGGADRR